MGKYLFESSSKVEDYCDRIVSELVNLFNISKEEAIGRVSFKWSKMDFIDDDSMRFHMLPEEWAYDIYYGANSFWWKKDIKDLLPLPYKDQN